MTCSRSPRTDGAAVRLPPPLLFLFATILGGVTGVVMDGGTLPVSRSLGLILAALFALPGVGLILWAGGLFQKTGQDPRPWLATPELIVSGIYRFTRNPMYVAMALLQTAFGLGLRSAWILLLLPVSIVVVYLTAIRHEERYLEEKFGNDYVAYKRQVRRWL